MHVAFLTPEYPHPEIKGSAGLGTSIKNLAAGLIAKEIQVTVFVYDQQKDVVFNHHGITIHSIAKRKFKLGGWYLYRNFLQRYVNKYITQNGIHILEAPDWTGITAFMSYKCPLIIRLHGSDGYFCNLENRPQKFKNRLFEKSALRNADYILSVSQFCADLTFKIFNLKRDIKVILNGVDTAAFKPEKETEVDFQLLYFGSIIGKKGVLELAKIMNLVFKNEPKTRLVLAGADVKDIFTQRSTQELFLEGVEPQFHKYITFREALPYNEIKTEIAKASVVVLPSFAEALPMTWIEAMAMQKALVTSDIGWANEIMIDGETGFSVDPKNHLKFSDRILELLHNSALREKMGAAARKRVDSKFALEHVVDQNILFYKKVIAD
ncbi:glycosyltransferase family 4 protein [Leeuwenhoekiella sp. NPDC079379]|uniref:glycosyltransferase family 4 protein n=1 Tax=Leeuwenhoekiella sp. NPDC079379 TaxID=3364122 RepID=UPI0037CB32D9